MPRLPASLFLAAAAVHAFSAQAASEPRIEAGAHAACQMLVHVRAAQLKAHLALAGDADAFDSLSAELAAVEKRVGGSPVDLRPWLLRAKSFAGNRPAVLAFHQGRAAIVANTTPLVDAVDKVVLEEMVHGLNASRLAALNQLTLLAQRIPRSAGTLVVGDRPDAESWFLLGKDAKSFTTLLKGLREGNRELRLPAAKGKPVIEALAAVESVFAVTSTQIESTLGGLRGLVEAAELQAAVQGLAQRQGAALEADCFRSAR